MRKGQRYHSALSRTEGNSCIELLTWYSCIKYSDLCHYTDSSCSLLCHWITMKMVFLERMSTCIHSSLKTDAGFLPTVWTFSTSSTYDSGYSPFVTIHSVLSGLSSPLYSLPTIDQTRTARHQDTENSDWRGLLQMNTLQQQWWAEVCMDVITYYALAPPLHP